MGQSSYLVVIIELLLVSKFKQMAKDCEQEVLSTTLKQFHSKLRAEVKLCA